MKFDPKNILSKLGWSEGQGLGKDNQGNKDPIKVTYKFDKTGLGHDFSKNYDVHSTFSLSFDNTVQNLKVVPTEDGGVKVVSEAPKQKETKVKALGTFVKSSRLNNGELAERSSDSSDDSDSDTPNVPAIAKLTDEELFKICGGMTGHRAGKFGINQAAKLARIKEQDELARKKLENENGKKDETVTTTTTTNDAEESESKPKKQKKNKKSKHDNVSNESEKSNNDILAPVIVQLPEITDDNGVKQKKKKSKKDKSSKIGESSNVENVEVCEENVTKKKKHKKSKENRDNVNTQMPVDDEVVKSEKSKKRKKQTSDEDFLVEENPSKKRKLSEDVQSADRDVKEKKSKHKRCDPLIDNHEDLKISKMSQIDGENNESIKDNTDDIKPKKHKKSK